MSGQGGWLTIGSGAMPWRPSGMRARLMAGGAHLMLSLLVASVVLALVYLGWYAAPLDRLCGVGEVLVLLLAVDVTLGPLLTLIVFDRRKKSLRFDLACIAVLQVGALGYGLHTVEAGRPHYVVFVKDRFEIVSRADLLPEDRLAGKDNPQAVVSWSGPRMVAARLAASDQERREIVVESAMGGRDYQHFPVRYETVGLQGVEIAAKGLEPSSLRSLNPGREAEITNLLDQLAGPKPRVLKYLPVKGPRGDATMFVDAESGEPLRIADFKPW